MRRWRYSQVRANGQEVDVREGISHKDTTQHPDNTKSPSTAPAPTHPPLQSIKLFTWLLHDGLLYTQCVLCIPSPGRAGLADFSVAHFGSFNYQKMLRFHIVFGKKKKKKRTSCWLTCKVQSAWVWQSSVTPMQTAAAYGRILGMTLPTKSELHYWLCNYR